MATITTRSGKGSPLTNNEVDANFNNLNTDKAELSGAAFTGAITTNSTFDGRDVATDGTKLDGIESGATADQTAAQIKTAYESNSDTNAFTDADESKLDGIEASADVTDAINVEAAGGLMDSELTSIASVKALNQGVATTDSPTFVDVTATSLDISGNIDVDGTTNLDVVDIDGAVDMASTLQVDGSITSSDGMTITTADNSDTLTLVSTDADSFFGPNLNFYRNSSSPADNDLLAQIDFNGRNDNSQNVLYANIQTQIIDASDGTEDGRFQINTIVNGTDRNRILLTPSETVLNENSVDLDFRVESNGNANMLFVDGGANRVGVGTGSPNRDLHISGGASDIAFGITNSASGTSASDGFSITVENPTPDVAIRQRENANMKFLTNNTERFRIASDGSLHTLTLGTSNVRFGVNAGNSIASGGNYNVVVGDEAGTAITTGDENVAVGYNALAASTTAGQNTAVGASALLSNTSGQFNSALGREALKSNTEGAYNTAMGRTALAANTTANNNVAVGYASLTANTTGAFNTAVGALAGDALTTASYNVALGYLALSTETAGQESVAIGSQALATQNVGSGAVYNTAVGTSAGRLVTTGVQNTLIGGLAGDATTTGGSNTALGYQALTNNTTGGNNVAVGANASWNNSTGTQNVSVGVQALNAATTASNNTAMGYQSLYANTTGASNTAVGRSALYANTTGTANTAVGSLAGDAVTTANDTSCFGYAAGGAVTTGHYNTCIGREAGLHTTSLTTGVGNTILGSYAHTSAVDSNYANVIGHDVSGATNYTTLGHAGSDIRAAHGNVTWATVSDERYKKDITDSTTGLSFINALQPRTFKYKTLGELPETFSAYEADSTEVFKNSDTNHGFIAQEIKAAIDADSSIADGFRLWDDREDGSQEVAEAALIPVLTKAIQELSAQVDALTARIETLEG